MELKFFMDNDTTVQKMLETEPERIVAAMLGAIDEGVGMMAAQIRENVSGGVLQRRTGTLEESVQPQAPKITGVRVDEDIKAAEGWAYYGRIQEKGVDHQWQEENLFVGHPMAFETAGENIFRTLVEHPALPAHPWFFPVLEEFAPQVVEKVKQAVNEELKKG